MMKKTILTIVALLGMMGASAQQAWNFDQTPESDVNALKAATTEWSYDETNNRYSNKAAQSGAVKAGGNELQMTKGLTIDGAGEGKLKIDVNKRIQLGGKNITLATPSLKQGQVVTIVFASTGATAATFDVLTNLSGTSGFSAADKNTTQMGTGTVAADGVVSFKSTSGSLNVVSISVSGQQPDDDQPQTGTHDVAKNTGANQAYLTLKNNDIKYYNTDDLTGIQFDDQQLTVSTATAQDVYNGTVRAIGFVKKTEQGQPGDIINGDLTITESKGWLESLYAKWNVLDGAKGYNVYVKGGQYGDFTKIDQQLVRNYGTYGRADVVGLKAGTYELKVIPVNASGSEETAKGSSVSNLEVRNYDRAGFAHKGYSGVGAYNDDGTLKSGARVLYVTKNTAKTVKASVTTSNKGAVTECTGLQAIIDAYQKGYDTTPLDVRFIGLLTASDMDSFSSSAEGLQIKGKNADSELNITIEGIGDDATVQGFGFLVRNAKSVEFRNFGIMRCMDDGISLDTDNTNIWIHHIDVFYGKQGSGDHAKGDGAIDIKSDSKFVTMSYCHFWDTGKSNMLGMKGESGPNYISYHHNWFDHSDSRHPRIRTMSVHVWNNYFDGNSKYGVGVTTGASCFAENNYFRHTHDPLLSSKQGTDAKGSGTFSGEDGGIIKSFGNIYAETDGSYYVPVTYQSNSSSFDCYEATSRDEQVPATVKTLSGGTTYNNFDTDAGKMYQYTPDETANVPAVVTGYYGAGRLNHGDCQYTFNNATDDTDYDVNAALARLIDGYTTSLKGIFGDENAESGEQGSDDPGNQGGDPGSQGGGSEGGDTGGQGGSEQQPEGVIFCTFDKNGTPSNSFFTVTGNGSNSKGEATIDGTTYTTCLKLESATSVKFTLERPMKMTLYFGSQDTKFNIKIDGTKTTGANAILQANLEAGSHELTKADTGNLFGIKLEPTE